MAFCRLFSSVPACFRIDVLEQACYRRAEYSAPAGGGKGRADIGSCMSRLLRLLLFLKMAVLGGRLLCVVFLGNSRSVRYRVLAAKSFMLYATGSSVAMRVLLAP